MSSAEQLEEFISKYTPDVAATARAAIKKMRARFKSAYVLVYDNYNALAVGFAPGERTSEAVFSLAVYPKYVSLFFFLNAHRLKHPRLKGTGKTTRHIVLKGADDLDDPSIVALMEENAARAPLQFASSGRGKLVIKSVSAAQRPRRPG